ncbi:hypothetical protein NBRC116596_01220 [Litorivita sp. NS0012-18]
MIPTSSARMPTGAKLMAAICLAGLGWIVSNEVRMLLPDQGDFGWFNVVNGVIGAACGWFILGTRAGQGRAGAIANGVTGVFMLVFWAIFVHAGNEMLRLSMRRRFDGPMEALAEMFQTAIEYALILADPLVIGTLAAGAVISGLLTEFTASRFK